MTRIIARLTKDMSIAQATKLAAKLPTDLNEAPYKWLMWDPNKKIMLNGHKVTIREVLLYMLDQKSTNYSKATLKERYRRETGNETAVLPERVA